MRKPAENAVMRSGQRATNCKEVLKGRNRTHILAGRETMDDDRMAQICLAISLAESRRNESGKF